MKISIKNILVKSIYIFISSLIFLSCTFNVSYNNRFEDKKKAEEVANKFYSLIKNGKYDNTYKLFSKKLFTVTDTSQLTKLYRITLKRLGAINNINLDHWETHIVIGTNSNSNYVLYYLVDRKKYESKETFFLSKENGSIKIDGYQINSDGLLADDSTK